MEILEVERKCTVCSVILSQKMVLIIRMPDPPRRMTGQWKKMAKGRLSLEPQTIILKWYREFKNPREVQRQRRREFAREPPTRLTVTIIRDKLRADVIAHDVRTCSASSPVSVGTFTRSPQKFAKQCAHEPGKSNVHKDEELVSKIVWSSEETFTASGTVERTNCVYGARENPHIHVDKAINSLGLTVWCGLSCRGLIRPFLLRKSSQYVSDIHFTCH